MAYIHVSTMHASRRLKTPKSYKTIETLAVKVKLENLYAVVFVFY